MVGMGFGIGRHGRSATVIRRRPCPPTPKPMPTMGKVPRQIDVEIVARHLTHSDLGMAGVMPLPQTLLAARNRSCKRDSWPHAMIGKQFATEDAQSAELVCPDGVLEPVDQRSNLGRIRLLKRRIALGKKLLLVRVQMPARSALHLFGTVAVVESHQTDVKQKRFGNWSNGVCTCPLCGDVGRFGVGTVEHSADGVHLHDVRGYAGSSSMVP